MATYRDIQNAALLNFGFSPKTCWIADVLESLGFPMRRAANRIDLGHRKHPCPADKKSAIIAVINKLGKIGEINGYRTT